MKVTAYKDPVTGLLFEDKGKLDAFVANRKREEAAQAKLKASRAAAEAVRNKLVLELDSRDKFEELASQMYEHALNNTKLRRNKEPLKLRAINVSRWAIDTSLRLSMDVEVLLSGDPAHTYVDTFVRLSPVDVLYPFKLWGCGSSTSGKSGYSYCYSMEAPLEKFPKLMAKMRAAALLLREEEAHTAKVVSAGEALKATDAKLAEFKAQSASALAALEDAQRAYAAAVGAQAAHAARLEKQARDAMPFAQQAELAALCNETEMPNAGQTDRWLALAVRNALLERPVPAELV